MGIEFLAQMRQSKNCGSVRGNDEIFNLCFGCSVGPPESHLFIEALESTLENIDATCTDLLSYHFTTWSPELTSTAKLTFVQ